MLTFPLLFFSHPLFPLCMLFLLVIVHVKFEIVIKGEIKSSNRYCWNYETFYYISVINECNSVLTNHFFVIQESCI